MNWYENTIKEALGEMEHCVEIGNILLQMPEDEKVIAGIMVALKKQIPKKFDPTKRFTGGGYCPSCEIKLWGKAEYCGKCGQSLDWD